MEPSGRNQCAPPLADDLATEAERGDVAHARTLELERARRRLHAHSLVAVSVRERLAATLVAFTAEDLAQLLLERTVADTAPTGRLLGTKRVREGRHGAGLCAHARDHRISRFPGIHGLLCSVVDGRTSIVLVS